MQSTIPVLKNNPFKTQRIKRKYSKYRRTNTIQLIDGSIMMGYRITKTTNMSKTMKAQPRRVTSTGTPEITTLDNINELVAKYPNYFRKDSDGAYSCNTGLDAWVEIINNEGAWDGEDLYQAGAALNLYHVHQIMNDKPMSTPTTQAANEAMQRAMWTDMTADTHRM